MVQKIVIPLFIVLIILAGCAPASPSATEAPAVAAAVATAVVTEEPAPVSPASAFPLSVVDYLDREISFDAAPQRIISLSPTNTEIIYAVGAGSLMVGDSEYCDYPAEAAALPKVGGFTSDSISIETILSLKPDVVFANSTDQEAAIEALEQANVKVVALNAASFDDVYSNIELVGKISDHSTEAAALVDAMKARVAAVEAKVAGIPEADRIAVFWEVWDEPLMTVGPNTFTSQIIQAAGGENIFADLAEDYPQVSAEEIVKRNPAVILGPDTHGDKLIAAELAKRPGWDQIDAVKNEKIFLLDGNISSRSGPRIVDALETVAKSLYPDLFE